jgi:sensor domain CHASE-containing protein
MMPHLSIRARLIFLSILLLAILATSLVLLSRELARDSEALAEEAGYVFIVKNALGLAAERRGSQRTP